MMIAINFRLIQIWLLTFSAAMLALQPAASASPEGAEGRWDLYSEILAFVDDRGMVDYRGLKENRTLLDRFSRQLAETNRRSYEEWADPTKIAFWTNAYNGLTLLAIIDHYPIESSFFASLRFPENSIRQISGVWDELSWSVMGRPMTLDDIEHETLRKEFDEPRIHVALVCAAMGCPPLRNEPYTGPRLDSQLQDQGKQFLTNEEKFRIDRENRTVYLSKIFDWYGRDFVGRYKTKGFGEHGEKIQAVLHYISRHLPEPDREYLRRGDYSIEYLSYDWSLNETSYEKSNQRGKK